MSDYNLGTAHGKIKIDYEDKGNKKALADMEKLKAQAGQIMSKFGALRKRWYNDTHAMASDVTNWGQQLGVFAGALYFTSAGLVRFSNGINGFKGANNIFSALGLSMGMVPKGAEKFPKVILDIIRLTAAIGVIQTSLGLLGRLGAKFSTLRIGGAVFRAIGGAVSALGINLLTLSRHIGMIGIRFRSLSIFNPIFFAMQRAVAALGVNVVALGGHLGRLRLGLAPLARAPGVMNALSGAIGKAAGPFRVVSGLALSLAGTIAELNIAKKLIKPLLGIQAGIGGLSLAIKLAHSLASEIARLGGLLPLAIGALFTFAAAAGVAMVGFKGFGEAIKSGDISKLPPEMGKAVTAVRGLRGEFDTFRKSLQGRIFAGIGAEIDGFKGKLASIQGETNAVADGFNMIMKSATGYLKSTVAMNLIKTILSQTAGVLKNVSAAIAPFLSALLTIGSVGAGVFEELTRNIGASANTFDQWIQTAKQTGQLEAWMKNAIQSVKDLWGALKAIKGVWDTVRAALSGGEVTPFFEALKNGAQQLDAFLKSAKGQEALATLAGILERGETTLRALGDAIVTYVLPALASFQPYITALSEGAMQGLILGLEVLTPLFKGLGEALSFMAPIFKPIMASMVKTVVIIAGLVILFKIAAVAIFMLKYALDTIKLGFKIAGFAARLFTGNLRAGEKSALRFAWTLMVNLVKAIFAKIKAMVMGAAATVRYVAMLVWGAITTAARWVWARIVIVAQFLWIKIQAAASAIWSAMVWVAQHTMAAARTVAAWLFARIQLILGWLLIRVSAMISAIQTGLVWVIQTIISTARVVLAWTLARMQLILGWLLIRISSLISAIGAFIPWAIQAIINTARMVLAWTIARIQLIMGWLLIRISAMISAITAFVPWAIQSMIATGRMILAWTIARIRLMVEWMILKVSSMINAITAFIPWAIQSMIATARMVMAWVIARIQVMIQWVMMKIGAMINAIQMALAWLIANGPAVVMFLITVITTAIAYIAQWVIMAIGAMANAIMMAAAWFIALGPIGWVIAIVIGLVILIILNWDKIKSFTINTFNTVSQWIETKINQAKAIVSAAVAAIKAFFTNGFNAAKAAVLNAFVAIVVAVATKIAQVKSFVSNLCSAIPAFFNALPGILRGIGMRIINAFLDGLKAAFEAVKNFIGGIGDWIAAHKGPPEKDRKLLIPAGKKIMLGLIEGLASMMPKLRDQLDDVTGMIAGTNAGLALNGAAKGSSIAGAQAATNAVSTWNPYARPTGGGVDENAGATNNDFSNMSVTIPAKDIKEMQDVAEFFDAVEQKARAGKGGTS